MGNWGDMHEMPIRIDHLDAGYGEATHGIVHAKTVPFAIIAQAVDGAYLLRTPQGTYRAADGQVFLTPADMPLVITHLARDGEKTMRFRFVHFRFSYMGIIDLFELYELPATADSAANEIFDRIIDQMVDIKQRENGLSFAFWAKKNELAFRLLHVILQHATPKAEHVARLAVLQELQPLLRYIHDNLHEPIDIGRLLRLFPFSRASLFSLFRNHFKQTPMEYVKSVRLKEAFRMLCTTSQSIAEIAEKTGFASSFHFSREFKARYHASPSTARKDHRAWEENTTRAW